MALARATFISLLGALFDRLQLQAAAELSKRLTELLPSSAREKTKRSPSSRASADVPDTAAIFAGFPRQCSFYEQMLIALLKIDSDCGEQIIKVLLMWQPRHFFDHTLSSAAKSSTVGESNSWILGSTRLRNRGFTFAAFLTLIEPLRQLDQGYMELIGAFVEVIISEYLRAILLRREGPLSPSLLEKLNESFLYYTKPSTVKYMGPDPTTFARLKAETNAAWLSIYSIISANTPVDELAVMRVVTAEEVLRFRNLSLENIGDLIPAVQFLERIAAGVNGCKKTKLRAAWLLCFDRAVSSIDYKHKQWSVVSMRMSSLFRRACKWAKTDGLESTASPLAAVLLLRSYLPPEELLIFLAKRIKALHSEQTLETSLRTLLALLRGSTRDLDAPLETLQKADKNRIAYTRTPLADFPNMSVALGMMLDALLSRYGGHPATQDIAVEVLLQIAAHDVKLLLLQVQRHLEKAKASDASELLLILRTLSRMADPATNFWKTAASIANASKSETSQLSKALQAALAAALCRAFGHASSVQHSPNAFAAQPVPCVAELRLLPCDENGKPLTNAVMQAFQRCEARLLRIDNNNSSSAKTNQVVEVLREKSATLCLPLSAVHVQTTNLEDSLRRLRLPSSIITRERRNTVTGATGKRPKGEKQIAAELLREAFHALTLLGTAQPFGDAVVQSLFSPDDEVALACALALQRLVLSAPAERAPLLRALSAFVRRLAAEQEVQLCASAHAHLLALVDLCLLAPYADPKGACRSRRSSSLFTLPAAPPDTSLGAELEAVALIGLCSPLPSVRLDSLALLEAADAAFRNPAHTSLASAVCASPLIAQAALSSLLAEAWAGNDQPLPELRSCGLSVADLAQADAPLAWLHVLRRIAHLAANSHALPVVRAQLIEYTQRLLADGDASDRQAPSSFALVLRANLSALFLALQPDASTTSAADALGRCVCGTLAALGSDNENALLDLYSVVLGSTHPDCMHQLIHSVSGWYCTDFARFGQKRKARARQVLLSAFRRLVCASSFQQALQRSREPLPFLITFVTDTEVARPITWDSLTQLFDLTSLLSALASLYCAPICALSGGVLRMHLKAAPTTHDKLWPLDQRIRFLRSLLSSTNALQDSAVVAALVEKAEAQRRDQKDAKVKSGARRQVDAALVRLQMNAWRAAEAVLRLGGLGSTKAEEVCDETFTSWCLTGERSGVPLLRWLLAHHWSQFLPRYLDKCYTPAETAALFVSALLDQYLALDATTLSDEQQRSLESVPLAPEDSAFAKRTTEASPQLLLLLLHETASPDLAARNRALSVLVRLAATNFGRADASSSAAQELAQLHHSLYNTSLTCPHLPTWRTAARRVMNAAAAICAQALAPPLFYETINRWRFILPARREWVLESLLPFASTLRVAALPNVPDFLRRLLTETVLCATLPLAPSLAALWQAITTAEDNCSHVVSFLVSCGSEARHICEASRALLESLYCSAPERVAPPLVDRLTCDSTLQLLSNASGVAVQDAFLQRDVVCQILVDVALVSPPALVPLLPTIIAFTLPRLDLSECTAARSLLARVCQVLALTAAEGKPAASAATIDTLKSFATKLSEKKNPFEVCWNVEGALLEAPLVSPDVPEAPLEPISAVHAVDLLRAITAALSSAHLNALGSQLLGWSLRYQDLSLSLRTQELFLCVRRPLDAVVIDGHLCALLETLTDLEKLPAPVPLQRKATDLHFAQWRLKALLLLRTLQAAVETASAEVLHKLFWSATSLLDIPSLPFLPLLDVVLALLNSILRHPLWPAAEHQACAALPLRGADFEGLLWPILKSLCTVRTEKNAFGLLCTVLLLEVKSELLLRPASPLAPLVATLAAMPWLCDALTRSPAPAAALASALAPYKKHTTELMNFLRGSLETSKPEAVLKGTLTVFPLSAALLDEVTPLLIRLSSFAPPRIQNNISRLCRSLLGHQRLGSSYLEASQHLLRAALVQASPVSFEALLPVFSRALHMAAKEKPPQSSADANDVTSPPAPALRLPAALTDVPAQNRTQLSSRLGRLVEATPALAAQATAHKYLTQRQRSAARSVLSDAEVRALVELQRLADHNDAAAVCSDDIKELQDMIGSNDSLVGTQSMSMPRLAAPASPPPPPRSLDPAQHVENIDVKMETREPQEGESEADDGAQQREEEDRDAELDALIAAAESKFRGFDMAALAAATAALAALNG